MLEAALQQRSGVSARIDVGRVDPRGKGLCRSAYAAEAEIAGDPSSARSYVVLLPNADTWELDHLPPPTPASLLHGDLLGQNILMLFDDDRLGLIDWENARIGDPAYDLAIVTRGVRRPFKVEDGLARLVDAYEQAGGEPVAASEVHLYELWLITRWYCESLAGEPGHPPEQYLNQLRGVLRRAVGSEGAR